MFFGVPKEVQEEIEETVVVAPEDPKKTGVVKIEIKNDYVKIFYPKDSDFREIVKEKEYSWSGTAWEFKKTSTSGELIDRAAEIGNALLANGFTVQFPDEETKNLAISGTFEPKYDNWILLNKSAGKLSIVWKGYNDFLFQKSKLLPGAKWSNGFVLVSAEFYREVEEFAQLMGFRFSQSAIEAIEKYKATEECYERKKVQEVTSESIDYEEKLRTVLEKEGVIEDLSMIKLSNQLLPHQMEAVEKLIKLKVGALFMEQGTGKSITTFEIARRRYLAKNRFSNMVMSVFCKGEYKTGNHKALPQRNAPSFYNLRNRNP